MLLKRFRAIIKDLNEIRFVGLTEYNMGSVLTIPVSDVLQPYPKSLKLVFKSIIAAFFLKTYIYNVELQPEAKILFLFSHSYMTRDDHKETFNKVTSLLQIKDTMIADVTHTTFYTGGFFLILYLPIWLVQMRRMDINLKDKIYLASFIAESKKWTSSQEFKVSPRKYNLLVTFCDAHWADNIMTQHVKKAGIITATLQHGWNGKTLQNAESFSNINLSTEGFVSDKFLAWGDYEKKVLIQNGIDSECVVSVGHPKFIDYKKIEVKNNRTRVLGIILSRSSAKYTIQENKELIEIANSISQEFGLKYTIKYHPGDSVNDIQIYDSLINPEYLCSVYSGSISLEKYIGTIEYSIVGFSSVYAEWLYMGHATFRYTAINDSYDEVEWGQFQSKDDLSNLLKAYLQNRDIFNHKFTELGQLLCGRGNIGENYKSFFRYYF